MDNDTDAMVEQADRDAAAEYLATIVPTLPKLAERVSENQSALARAFAVHRLSAERARDTAIVAWLREQAFLYGPDGAANGCAFAEGFDMIADAIEAGDIRDE